MHFETRAVSRCGHVYRQINRMNPSWNTASNVLFQCDCCHAIKECIGYKSDIILCYERYNDSYNSLRTQADSFMDYKRLAGNYGVDTYLLYYSTYKEFCNLWNNMIPERVRHIYDYGHGFIGGHAFQGDDVYVVDILTGKREALKQKKVSGDVYTFCCCAGSVKKVSKDNQPKMPSSYTYDYTGVMRFFAYICPNTNVIGASGTVDYDESTIYYGVDNLPHTLILPSCSDVPGADYKFAVDYYDSSTKSFASRMYLTSSIRATNFMESYL